jgi:hypothetical protein
MFVGQFCPPGSGSTALMSIVWVLSSLWASEHNFKVQKRSHHLKKAKVDAVLIEVECVEMSRLSQQSGSLISTISKIKELKKWETESVLDFKFKESEAPLVGYPTDRLCFGFSFIESGFGFIEVWIRILHFRLNTDPRFDDQKLKKKI